jgi:ATPase MipZ
MGRHKAGFLRQLASRLGFRIIDGLARARSYEAFFPHGLTALDDAREVASAIEFESVAKMREEVRSFVETLADRRVSAEARCLKRRVVCFTRQVD